MWNFEGQKGKFLEKSLKIYKLTKLNYLGKYSYIAFFMLKMIKLLDLSLFMNPAPDAPKQEYSILACQVHK